MAKQLRSKQILDRATRTPGSAWLVCHIRLKQIKKTWSKSADLPDEALRYFPIALIATIEGYIRLAVEELLDAGGERSKHFIEKSKLLLDKTKISFETIVEILDALTIGKIVGHVIPISSLEDINSVFKTLTGEDLLTALKAPEKFAHGTPIEDPATVYRALSRTFELRHIFAHELAPDLVVSRREIEQCLKTSEIFLSALQEYVSSIRCPGKPLPQQQMNREGIENGKALDRRSIH
jgi:hypothetical protein